MRRFLGTQRDERERASFKASLFTRTNPPFAEHLLYTLGWDSWILASGLFTLAPSNSRLRRDSRRFT